MDDESRLSVVVRQRREALGLTQDQIRDITGIEQTHLSQIERGEIKRPRRPLLSRLASALSLPVAELLIASGQAVPVKGADYDIAVPLVGRVPADAFRFSLLERFGEDVQLARTQVDGKRAPLFAVIASGDCLLSRKIMDGMTVVLENITDPAELRSGQIVLIRVDDEVTLKVWRPQDDGSVILEDGSGQVIAHITDEEFSLLGRAFYWFYAEG